MDTREGLCESAIIFELALEIRLAFFQDILEIAHILKVCSSRLLF